MSKIIVLSASAHENLVQTAQKRGHDIRVIDPDNLYLMLSDANGHDRIYEKTDRIALKNVDAIIPRIGKNLNYGLAVVNHFSNNLGIYSTSNADGLRTASDKFWTSQKLSEHRVKIPKTIFAKKPDHVDFLIDKVGGLPTVAKTLSGSQGAGVSIFETPLTANTTMQTFYKLEADVHLQQYLEAKGKDIRAIVIDDQVIVAMERTANKGDFRANLGAGGSGRKIDLTEAEKDMAIKAAQAVGLGSFAGVDLVRTNDTTYCIEVNGNPGTKIIDITGVNYNENLIDMVEKYTGKKGNESRSKATFLSKSVNYLSEKVFGKTPSLAPPSKRNELEQRFDKEFSHYASNQWYAKEYTQIKEAFLDFWVKELEKGEETFVTVESCFFEHNLIIFQFELKKQGLKFFDKY